MNKKIAKLISLFLILGIVCMFSNSCKKDEPPETTVTDIDGNVYNIDTIGTQVWIIENLKTTRYRNGDLIGTTIPATLNIRTENMPKYQWPYNGDESNVDKYGRLYTWYAVNDSRNIAPKGWHVATIDDWEKLIGYLINNGYGLGANMYDIAGSLASTSDWNTSSQIGTIGYNLANNNKSGFTAYPGGYRNYDGSMLGLGIKGYWWSSTEKNVTDGIGKGMDYNQGNLTTLNYLKYCGYSVRCIKD